MALLTLRDELRDALPGRLQPLLPASRAARRGRAGRLSMPSLLRLLERIERSPGYQRLAAGLGGRLARRGANHWQRAIRSIRIGPGRHTRGLRRWLARHAWALRAWLIRVGLIRATARPAETPAAQESDGHRPEDRPQVSDDHRPEDRRQVWVGRATVADPAAPAAPAAPADPTGRTAVGRAPVPDPEAAAPVRPKRAPRAQS